MLDTTLDSHLGVTLIRLLDGTWIGAVDGQQLYAGDTRDALLAEIDADLLPEAEEPCRLCNGLGYVVDQPTPWVHERRCDCPDCLGSGVA